MIYSQSTSHKTLKYYHSLSCLFIEVVGIQPNLKRLNTLFVMI